MKELKDFVMHRESLRQMSKEQIKELNTQQGWFSNNIEDFKDFNTLNQCWYDGGASSQRVNGSIFFLVRVYRTYWRKSVRIEV